MRRNSAFTLLEILLAVFIASLMLMAALPSVQGVLTEKRMKASFEKFDEFVQMAQSRSIAEQRTYLIEWQKTRTVVSHTILVLRTDDPKTAEETSGVAHIECGDKEDYGLILPAGITFGKQKAWMFWPNGTCEPATISFKGPAGNWSAVYDPLTTQPNYSRE